MVNEGQAMLDGNEPMPGTDDLIYNGNLTLWRSFGNTLKLRVLMRQSEIRPTVAAAGIAAMFAAVEPFLASGEDAKLFYVDQKYQQSPLYTTGQALSTTSNIYASKTITDYLTATGDARIDDFFALNGSGIVVGLAQGSGKLLGGNQSDASWSKPSAQIIGPLSSTVLISAAESNFLQAEAIARGYTAGDAKAAYEAGITASWNSWTNSGAAAGAGLTPFLASDSINYSLATTLAQKLKLILTQKWVAMTGNQNFEAWSELRRTGIPAFAPSVTSVLAPGKFPGRIAYPSDEVTSNKNFPGIKTVDINVWWDAN